MDQLRDPGELILDLVQAVGTTDATIASVTVHQGFSVIERGHSEVRGAFSLDDHIQRRPIANPRQLLHALRRTARDVKVSLRR